MSCCWIGRGGNSARTSAGRFRITWPRSWTGWGSIDRTGWKLCAASVDYSSRRRGDRARSSMPRRAARGAGSRARRRLEPPLCRPLARRRAVNRHLHYAFTRRAWPPRALNSLPDAVSTGRTVQLLTSSDHAHTTVVSIRSVSDRLEAPRADALVDCSDRRVRGSVGSRTPIASAAEFASLWVSELPITSQFLYRVRCWLRPDGCIVASMPNVRHHSVVSSLLEGNWSYEPAGLLDETHLRFFTRATWSTFSNKRCSRSLSCSFVPGPGYEEWRRSGCPGEVA